MLGEIGKKKKEVDLYYEPKSLFILLNLKAMLKHFHIWGESLLRRKYIEKENKKIGNFQN